MIGDEFPGRWMPMPPGGASGRARASRALVARKLVYAWRYWMGEDIPEGRAWCKSKGLIAYSLSGLEESKCSKLLLSG